MRCFPVPLVIAFAMLVLASSSAAAGPWPREAGQGFFAFTVEAPAQGGASPDRFRVYGEFGLRPRLTFAASVEHDAEGQRQEAALRWHPPDLPGNIAWGFSAGLRRTTEAGLWVNDEPRAHLGVSLGRGFDTALGNIWARTDVTAVFGRSPFGMLEREMELAAQIGLRHDDWIGMFGITQDRKDDTSKTRIRPALGYAFGPRLTLVGEAALSPGGQRQALGLSLWSRF